MLVYGYLTTILLFLCLYIYMWFKGPRDGPLSRKIRILTHNKNYWRNEANRKKGKH